MKLDNLNNFTADKLQQVIEQRFGQKIELNELDDSSLDLFAVSVQESIKNFETAHSFNQNSHNARYMENKILLGIVSIGDVVNHLIAKIKEENKNLKDYINSY